MTQTAARPRFRLLALPLALLTAVAALTLPAAPAAAAAEPQIAPVIADAFVRDGSYADTAHATGTLAWKEGGAGFARRTFMTFDVAALQAVDRATLWLHGRVSGGSASDYPDVAVNLVTEVPDPDWTSSSLTWRTQPPTAPEPAATFVLGGAQDQTNRWHAVDLTELVAEAVAADRDRLGIMLSRETASGPIVQMSSTRTSTPPWLEVNGQQPEQPLAPQQQLQPAHDTFVRDGASADTAFGTAATLQWKAGAAGFARETYLTFDLSQLDGRVERATLRLFGRVSGGHAEEYPDRVANRITEVVDPAWQESTLTWNSRPALGGDPARTFVIGGDQAQVDRWHEIDLSALVAAALADGRSQLGLAITREVATGSIAQVGSSRSANPPALEINGPPAVEAPPGGVVRSALYPEDWQPSATDAEGRFLHDFSYAGFAGGADVPQEVDGPVFDVTDARFGADPTGAADATLAIQAAIDAAGAAGGGTVHLPAGEYRVTPQDASRAVLHVPFDDVLLRGDGPERTRIYNATSVDMRQRAVVLVGPEKADWVSWHVASQTGGVPLTQDVPGRSTTLHLGDVSGFAAGDWVVLRTDPTEAWLAEHPVDPAQQWTTTTFGGLVYNRQITAVNPALGTVEIDIPTKYDMLVRDNLRLTHLSDPVRGSGIADLSIGMRQSDLPGLAENDHNVAGTGAWEAHGASAIAFNNATDGWVDDVHTYRPAANADPVHLLSGGVYVWYARSITVTGADMRSPQFRGAGGNGYMYHLMGSDTLVRDSYAEAGRHNYLIQAIQATGNVFLDSVSAHADKASELHRHLSAGNLFDNLHVIGDTIEAQYRTSSTHAHSGTQSVMWNISGEECTRGRLARSQQFGWGYVIGTSGAGECRDVETPGGANTEPVDWLEAQGQGDYLEPRSLYLDQRDRRLASPAAAPLVVAADAATAIAGHELTVAVRGAQPGSSVSLHVGTAVAGTELAGTAVADAAGTTRFTVPLPLPSPSGEVVLTAMGVDASGLPSSGTLRLAVATGGIAGLDGAVEAATAAGRITGPIAQQLAGEVDQAARHLAAGRTVPAEQALDRLVRGLEATRVPDAVDPTVAAELILRARVLLDAIR